MTVRLLRKSTVGKPRLEFGLLKNLCRSWSEEWRKVTRRHHRSRWTGVLSVDLDVKEVFFIYIWNMSFNGPTHDVLCSHKGSDNVRRSINWKKAFFFDLTVTKMQCQLKQLCLIIFFLLFGNKIEIRAEVMRFAGFFFTQKAPFS